VRDGNSKERCAQTPLVGNVAVKHPQAKGWQLPNSFAQEAGLFVRRSGPSIGALATALAKAVVRLTTPGGLINRRECD